MKKFTLLDRGVVMAPPAGFHDYFGWPSIARLQNGRLAAVASGFRIEHVCPFGKAVISFSENEGKTWSLPAPVIDTPLDDRDGGILPFGESSVLVTSFNNSTKFQQDCIDYRREKKERPQEVLDYVEKYLDMVRAGGEEEDYYGSTYRISRDMGVTWGEIHLSPITAPHGPILHNGKILYIGTTFSDGAHPADPHEIQCWEMDGEGGMVYLSSIPNVEGLTACEPHAISLPNGQILVHIRMESSFNIWQSESLDGGKTFSAPHPIIEERGGAPAHLYRHSKGRLFSVIGYRNEPFGIRALFSDDDGKSWECATITDDAPSFDLGYPAVAELSDGTLYMVWYQKEEEGSAQILGGRFDPYEC